MATITTTKPTLFLLESNLKWNPLLPSPNPFKPLFPAPKFPSSFKLNLNKTCRLRSLRCFFISNNSKATTRLLQKTESSMEIQENPLEKFAKIVFKALKTLQKPAVAAVLMGLLLMYDPNSALAASGGRVGGKSFSSSRSFSSSPSRSYSVPRTSWESSSLYSAPYYAPSPFGFGGSGVYVGPAVGVGSSFFFLMVGFAAFVLVSGFLSDRSEGGVLTATGKTSVLKLQLQSESELRQLKSYNELVYTAYHRSKNEEDQPSYGG